MEQNRSNLSICGGGTSVFSLKTILFYSTFGILSLLECRVKTTITCVNSIHVYVKVFILGNIKCQQSFKQLCHMIVCKKFKICYA